MLLSLVPMRLVDVVFWNLLCLENAQTTTNDLEQPHDFWTPRYKASRFFSGRCKHAAVWSFSFVFCIFVDCFCSRDHEHLICVICVSKFRCKGRGGLFKSSTCVTCLSCWIKPGFKANPIQLHRSRLHSLHCRIMIIKLKPHLNPLETDFYFGICTHGFQPHEPWIQDSTLSHNVKDNGDVLVRAHN